MNKYFQFILHRVIKHSVLQDMKYFGSYIYKIDKKAKNGKTAKLIKIINIKKEGDGKLQ